MYFQGTWKAPEIDNPDFVDDKELYKRGSIGYVAFEIWQVKSGSIFDNIMLTDSKEEAITFAKDTWGKQIEGEKAMRAKVEVCTPFNASPITLTSELHSNFIGSSQFDWKALRPQLT